MRNMTTTKENDDNEWHRNGIKKSIRNETAEK